MTNQFIHTEMVRFCTNAQPIFRGGAFTGKRDWDYFCLGVITTALM